VVAGFSWKEQPTLKIIPPGDLFRQLAQLIYLPTDPRLLILQFPEISKKS
jgi:hypothetical protein